VAIHYVELHFLVGLIAEILEDLVARWCPEDAVTETQAAVVIEDHEVAVGRDIPKILVRISFTGEELRASTYVLGAVIDTDAHLRIVIVV